MKVRGTQGLMLPKTIDVESLGLPVFILQRLISDRLVITVCEVALIVFIFTCFDSERLQGILVKNWKCTIISKNITLFTCHINFKLIKFRYFVAKTLFAQHLTRTQNVNTVGFPVVYTFQPNTQATQISKLQITKTLSHMCMPTPPCKMYSASTKRRFQ